MPAGRKSKYTPELVQNIIKVISLGLCNKSACEYVDISEETFYQWIKEYPEFGESIKRARTANKAALLAKIQKAGEKSWQAYAWLLERSYPQEFGSLVRQQISGGLNEYSKDDITELERKAEELARSLDDIPKTTESSTETN